MFWEAKNASSFIYKAMRNGRVVIGDSDTVLGLYAFLSAEGFVALNKLKGRAEKPYLVLVGTKEKAISLVDESLCGAAKKIMDACWPGPVTLVCKVREGLPSYIQSSAGTIALRVPDHKGLQKILSQCEGLFSTSANKAGVPVPALFEQVDSAILSGVFCAIFNGIGEESRDYAALRSTVASTILDCTGDQITLIREGAYPVSLIESKAGVNIK